MVQIVTLTSTLADTSEHRVTTMGLCNIVDQLLDKHSLSDTSAPEKANLSSTSIWCKQVDDYGRQSAKLHEHRPGRYLPLIPVTKISAVVD